MQTSAAPAQTPLCACKDLSMCRPLYMPVQTSLCTDPSICLYRPLLYVQISLCEVCTDKERSAQTRHPSPCAKRTAGVAAAVSPALCRHCRVTAAFHTGAVSPSLSARMRRRRRLAEVVGGVHRSEALLRVSRFAHEGRPEGGGRR